VVIDSNSVRFPAVGPENLVRLAEESLQVYSTLVRLNPLYGDVVADHGYVSSTSGLISRDATSSNELVLSGSGSVDGNVLVRYLPLSPCTSPVPEVPPVD
jgi:hypothetical protein